MTSRNRNQRGQALVESALTTLVFLILLIGTIDVGQVLFVHQSIVERVRNAVRYGAVRTFDENSIRNMVLYDQASVPDAGDGSEAPGGFLGITPEMVTVVHEDATFNEDRIVVTVDGYPFSFFNPLVAGVYQGKPITASIPYEVP